MNASYVFRSRLPGRAEVLDTSADLVDWSPLPTNSTLD
jgi:hypothetical protein